MDIYGWTLYSNNSDSWNWNWTVGIEHTASPSKLLIHAFGILNLNPCVRVSAEIISSAINLCSRYRKTSFIRRVAPLNAMYLLTSIDSGCNHVLSVTS